MDENKPTNRERIREITDGIEQGIKELFESERYELEYRIVLNGDNVPKDFLDALRCRNGNLNITCGRESTKEVL